MLPLLSTMTVFAHMQNEGEGKGGRHGKHMQACGQQQKVPVKRGVFKLPVFLSACLPPCFENVSAV